MANVSSSNGLEKYPKLRFLDSNGQEFSGWTRTVLGTIIVPFTEKVFGDHNYEVLTSSRNGIQRQAEHFAGKQRHDTDGYNIIPRGYCTYRNRSDDGLFTFNMNNIVDEGIVSKFYPVFTFQNANSTFMMEYLNGSPRVRAKLAVLAVGTSQVVLSFETLKETSFYLPTFEEQNRIATLLSTLNERIEKQRSLVEHLKKYKRGVISKLLSRSLDFSNSASIDWVSHRVGDFCTVQMCKRIFKEQTSTEGDVPFYKIGTIGGEPDAYISREVYEEYRRKYNFPRKGEFLISCAGTVGKCVVYNGEDSYYQDSNIVWLRNESEFVLNEYLYLLVSNVDWSTLNSTTITRIYNDNLRDLVFDFPPIEVQKKISEFCVALDKRVEGEAYNLSKLLTLKQGLIQGLFA